MSKRASSSSSSKARAANARRAAEQKVKRAAADRQALASTQPLVPLVRTADGWLTRRDREHDSALLPARLSLYRRFKTRGPMVRWSKRVARASDSSSLMQRFGKLAAELSLLSDGRSTVSIAITSTHVHNHRAATAIGVATAWARWGYRTLLICAGDRQREFGRAFRQTEPSIADLFRALSEGRRLPVPPALTSYIDNLDVLSGMDDLTLSRLAETNWLSLFTDACRTRYDRIVWSLPPATDESWSPTMFDRVVDGIGVAVRPGRSTTHALERLAEQVGHAGLPPVRVIWLDR